MSEDTVEKVARAIYDAEPLPEGFPPAIFAWEAQPETLHDSMRLRARAAINAMSDVREALEEVRKREMAIADDEGLAFGVRNYSRRSAEIIDAALESLSGGGGE